jgi:hypothetical protein
MHTSPLSGIRYVVTTAPRQSQSRLRMDSVRGCKFSVLTITLKKQQNSTEMTLIWLLKSSVATRGNHSSNRGAEADLRRVVRDKSMLQEFDAKALSKLEFNRISNGAFRWARSATNRAAVPIVLLIIAVR